MRRGAIAVLLILLLAGPPAAATQTYAIDQRFGEIAFSVNHLGMFSSHGTFRRWAGQLAIDETHPEHTSIDVTIVTDSVDMTWREALAMLRSVPYFDVARYPDARFVSTLVAQTGRDRYRIEGMLTLRGVTQPIALQAVLTGRHVEAGTEIADFVVKGALRRSAFGMTADSVFVSDQVKLEITARVKLDAAAHGG